MTRVGFIGLGAMGRPMAERLSAAESIELCVYDRDEGSLGPFREQGVEIAANLAALGAWANVVICMLPHPDVFGEVVHGPGGLASSLSAGDLVVDMATDGPQPVRTAAAALADRGIDIIDAPVGRGPKAASDGTLLILMGGDEQLCESAKAVLGHLGEEFHYCGPLGSGQVVKLANNLVQSANLALIAEACALARRAGADVRTLAHVMSKTAADSFQVRNGLLRKALNDDYSPIFRLALAHKDVTLATQLAGEIGAPSWCGNAALDWLGRGLESGMGDLDQSALIRLSEQLAAPEAP